jgi:small subunit ribosomal protein S5
MEVCGIQNVVSKSLGSGNPNNVVRATLNGLQKLQAPDEIKNMRRSDQSEEAGYVGKPAA